ncbi:hypothetical protein BC332_14196 [Capsicum chinense]|nr:hypothetical protein BC332_14196 [Capsicum chinense]
MGQISSPRGNDISMGQVSSLRGNDISMGQVSSLRGNGISMGPLSSHLYKQQRNYKSEVTIEEHYYNIPNYEGDKKFCVPKPEAKDEKLQACIKWVCKEGGLDCGPINAGGACFQPNTVRSRAAWAMNAYFQMKGKADAMCGFSGAGVISSTDPKGGVDCGPINPGGGGACSQPNKLRSRAIWAMNAYFQITGKTDSMCGFSGIGVVSSTDPSNGTCKYQS